MKFFLICLTTFFLLLGASGNAQIVQQSGSIYSEMAATISSMPGDSGNQYMLPSVTQRTNWNIALNNLIQGNYSFAASFASTLGYELVQFTDTFLQPNRTYYILRNGGTNYWGTYVYYPLYKRPLVIQSPHAKKDANTGHQGAYVFRQSESMLFMLTGTHRCNSNAPSSCTGTTTACSGTSQAYPVSDMAHDVHSIFQKTTEVFLNSFTNTYFIQLHGFNKLSTDPYVILSNGTQVTPALDYMATFKNMLFNEDTVLTFKVAHLDLSWTRLRGFWNTQGRLINSSPNPCNISATNSQGRFFHIEQERIRLRNTVGGWTKISNALINTFPATPLAVAFSDLHAQWHGKQVVVKWNTTSEQNTDFFQVERSLDAIHYDPIGEVQAKGISSVGSHYLFIDQEAHVFTTNKIYYRVRQYDVDYRSILSPTVLVQNSHTTDQYTIYPNPTKKQVFVYNVKSPLRYTIISAVGQHLKSGVLDQSISSIDISTFPAQLYFLRLGDQIVRFIKE